MKQIPKNLFPFMITMLLVIILSLVIIIFAEQYKFNPKTSSFIQTGMIEILGIEDAKIYMDDQYQGISPKTIKFVDDGDHVIRIEKDGRRQWQRTIHVSAGKVTTLFPILFPTNIDSTDIKSTLSVIPTTSPYNYLTVEFNNGTTELYLTELSQRLLDIGIKSIKIANLDHIIEGIELPEEKTVQLTDDSSNENVKLLKIKEKLAKRFKFNTSPKGTYTLITEVGDQNNKKVYLAELGQNNVKNVSSWFDLIIDSFYWSPDEEWIIVKSSSLLISINLKTGQRFILYNISENKQYGPITPIRGGVIFVINEVTENTNVAKIFTIDSDGKNLKENPLPEGGFKTIKGIFPIENAGVLLINADNSIWKQTHKHKHPILLKKGHEVVWVDNDQKWACSVDVTTRDKGSVFHFSEIDPDAEIKIRYPIPIEEIESISLINGHQNIIFQTKDRFLISTEDGENVINILNEEKQRNYTSFFLASVHHRGTFILRYSILEKDNNVETHSPEWEIKEVYFDN